MFLKKIKYLTHSADFVWVTRQEFLRTNYTIFVWLSMAKLLLRIILIIAACSFCTLNAEEFYVGDTLRVGVRPEPDVTLPSLSVIKSGTALEVIEQKGPYSKVRTRSGIEGWVKSAYLTSTPPALAQLKEANSKISALETQLEELKKNKSVASQNAQQELKNTIEQLQQEKTQLAEKINAISENQPSTAEILSTDNGININIKHIDPSLIYALLAVIIVLLLVGFLIGVSWYRQVVTKRLGGLSI